jgi:hypothetical protein
VLLHDGEPSGYVILSFAWVIEVKGHRRESIRFEGNKVFVKYDKGKEEDVSEQSEGEKFAVIGYLEKSNVRAPHICNFVWLTNVATSELPKGSDNIVGSNVTWREWIALYLKLQRGFLDSRNGVMLDSIFDQKNANAVVRSLEVFTKPLQSTPLNRQKVERITQGVLKNQQYGEKLGQQLLVFRGRGGTGKTVYLLQIAHDLYVRLNAKVLVLTYNVALVADIKRLLAIIGVRTEMEAPSIQICSVHYFLYHTLKDLGLPVAPNLFLQRFDELKKEAMNLGAIEPDDIEQWDYVLVDEAQDWPADERDLIFKIFGPQRVIIADGIDQMVRGNRPLDWRVAAGRTPSQLVSLTKSLRLKANICTFANGLAEELGLAGWRLDVNQELHGGRVMLVSGLLRDAKRFVGDLIDATRSSGNAPVDMLMCVPPTLARHTPSISDISEIEDAEPEATELSEIGKLLIDWGYKVWDGTSKDIRRSYPTDIEEIRVVQYDSCRGLEGWAVLNWEFEKLYDYKYQSFDPLSTDRDMFVSEDEARIHFAKSWLTIPLTRAIDTLVIHVGTESHPIWDALQKVAVRLGGLIDTVTLASAVEPTP